MLNYYYIEYFIGNQKLKRVIAADNLCKAIKLFDEKFPGVKIVGAYEI